MNKVSKIVLAWLEQFQNNKDIKRVNIEEVGNIYKIIISFYSGHYIEGLIPYYYILNNELDATEMLIRDFNMEYKKLQTNKNAFKGSNV